MAEFQYNLVSDGKGGQIKFPVFISQADMDLIEKEFVAKDDDVFVTTYPRSGTTWTEQMVHLLVNNGVQGEQRLTDAVPWLETLPHRPNGMIEFLKTLPQRRLFTSHLPYPLMPSLGNTTAKIVYVARNPKDVAISTYFHNQSKLGYEGTWEEHFQLFLTSDVGCGPYFDHILPWWQASQHTKNILFLKYEDMKRDHAGCVARIASFLGLQADPQLIDTVVSLSSFKSMTSNETTNFNWVPQREGVPTHFRKGDIGDWQNHFSAEQSQQMDRLFMEKMKDTGLQFDFGDGVLMP
ncbi:sulfotransferase domain-containing protein [Candidatus Villigracilis affinis]|uniref:sulfotransferase domain-containing protein n=1 Tax=Candidatus Villigracilis affinis TaxID=3140682 RepID=UPI001D1F6872|nr:sulfotransferase domain-containing protein [Anaerolineales bacterium]